MVSDYCSSALQQGVIRKKKILVRDLNETNLSDFYDGLPYRYNSIVDLVFQKEQIKQDLLRRSNLTNRLSYQVIILSKPTYSLPILECLEIDGIAGGMLSTYLHDLDREMIEGTGDICLNLNSMLIWQTLLNYQEFSFVFRSSRNQHSRTSDYMKKIGFEEQGFSDMRCFFNSINNGNLFAKVMKELITAIEGKNKYYSFKYDNFKSSKSKQAQVAQQYLNRAEHQRGNIREFQSIGL